MGNKKNSRTRIVLPMNPRKTTTEVLDRADQQQGTKKTMVSTRRGVEVVTVNKEEMEALRKAAKDDAKKKRELEKMAQEQKRFSRSWRRCKVRWRLQRNERKMQRPWHLLYPQTGRSKRKISMMTLSNIRWQLPKLSYFVKQNLWKIFSRKDSCPKTSFLILLWICLSQRRNSSTITQELCTMESRPHARMFSQTPRKGLKVCVLNKLILSLNYP